MKKGIVGLLLLAIGALAIPSAIFFSTLSIKLNFQVRNEAESVFYVFILSIICIVAGLFLFITGFNEMNIKKDEKMKREVG